MNTEKLTEKKNEQFGGKPNFSGKIAGATALKDDMKDVATQTIADWKEKAQDVMSNTREVADELVEKANELGGKAIDETRKAIRKYPAPILCAGIGVGFLIGLLVAKKKLIRG